MKAALTVYGARLTLEIDRGQLLSVRSEGNVIRLLAPEWLAKLHNPVDKMAIQKELRRAPWALDLEASTARGRSIRFTTSGDIKGMLSDEVRTAIDEALPGVLQERVRALCVDEEE